MAKTVAALFENHSEASEAVHNLIDHGIARSAISLMTRDDATAEVYTSPDDDSTGFLRGAGIGGAAGGITGLVVGLSALAIPGIGHAVVAGPLVAALLGAGLGAAAGGVTGALMAMGVPEEHARSYGEGVRRGGVLVTVAVTEKKAERAAAILGRHNPVDLSKRTEEWRQGGKTGFDPQRESYRSPAATRVPGMQREAERTRTAEAGVHARSSTAFAAGVAPSSHTMVVGSEPLDQTDREAVLLVGPDGVPIPSSASVDKEEMVVNKEAKDRAETIRDTVRSTDVKVKPEKTS